MLKFLQSVVSLSQRIKRRKKNEAKKRVSPANQKGKKRKGKIVETPFDSNYDFVSEIKKKKTTNVEVAQSSKPSTRRTTKKKELEIPISKKGKKIVRLYTRLFAEYISKEVFDMRSVDIDAKYHRQRYATIIWHYGKTKNDDGAINESEVIGIVASTFDGPSHNKRTCSGYQQLSHIKTT
ncbi:hypothetical protein H5410_063244 [Solanum commersonii]|uniref:Ulp1 protease family, C-terminal catalytic domain containing protein n=1 Tax=Solanum commersonii TaxID=4109 RepID=A0A9J5WF29_SOLCO|nr:hypothetical protein H5410_063244 [Solanum commersonii]